MHTKNKQKKQNKRKTTVHKRHLFLWYRLNFLLSIKLRVLEGYECSFSSHRFPCDHFCTESSSTWPWPFLETYEIHSRQVRLKHHQKHTLSLPQFDTQHSKTHEPGSVQTILECWWFRGDERKCALQWGKWFPSRQEIPSVFGIWANYGLRNALILA